MPYKVRITVAATVGSQEERYALEETLRTAAEGMAKYVLVSGSYQEIKTPAESKEGLESYEEFVKSADLGKTTSDDRDVISAEEVEQRLTTAIDEA